MSNNHGGRRQGSGRKKINITERVLNGTAGAAELPTLNVHGNLSGNDMPPPNDYLTKQSRGVNTENRGKEIYEKLWNWLKERDC
ncbi:MAG: terminase, partial [Clostridiaceae bacterium]|nr:terminase [Clostridiaceae bacterium]